jgi:hypothetical protein
MLQRGFAIRWLAALALGVAALISPSSGKASPYGFTGTITLSLVGNGLPFSQASEAVSGFANLTKSGGQIVGMTLPASFISREHAFTATGFTVFDVANSAGVFGMGQARLVGRMPLNGLMLIEALSHTLKVPLHALGATTTVPVSRALVPVGDTGRVGTGQGTAWSATSNAGNDLSLVAPVRIFTSLPSPADFFEVTGRIDLHFFQIVPEPGTALLLGIGIAGLARVARSKKQRAA